MPQITFEPFTYKGKTFLGKIFRPYLHLLLYSKARKAWQPVEMLVDTGADYTLLPKRYAQILGIDLTSDCRTEITFGVGGTETVYQYKALSIKIGTWATKIPVGFLKRDDFPPVLGRLECLEAIELIMRDFKTILNS
ncbi:MAG: retropepsin-like aspartic protease [Patescibacteria group bacterium]